MKWVNREAHPALPSLGHCPLLFPILGAVLGILFAEYHLWSVLVLLVVTGIYLGLFQKNPPLIAGALLALILAILHLDRLQEREELAATLSLDKEFIVSGTIVESNSAGLVRRLFQTETGARLILIGLPPQSRTGQNHTLVVQPINRPQKRNPSGWNPDKTLWKRGIAGSVEVISAQQTGWTRGFPILRGWSEDIRRALAQRVTSGIQDREAADIVQAVVLGEKASGSRAFEDFRKTGTMHIFAVSGLHVGLVALIVFGLGRLVRIPPRILLWSVVFAMLSYAFITGLRPPALRASLMGTLVIGRFLFLRRPSVVNNLFAAALIVLVIDSFQLWQAGFQLSFLVVGVILFLEPHFWKRLGPLLDHDPFLPKPVWTRWQQLTHWTRNKIGKMFTVSLAAWIGSAPLSIIYFGWFTPIAALASISMVMVAFLILVLAFLGLACGGLSTPVSDCLNTVNGLLAKSAQHSATQMSRWPGAWTRFHQTADWQDGLCVFDIKYGGAAIHLNVGGGVLIDAASESGFWWNLEPALKAHNLTFDSIIATHNDAHHIGGLESAVLSFPVKQALIPNEKVKYSLANLKNACREKNVALHLAQAGQLLPITEETRIEVLHPGLSEMTRADDRGLVLCLHHHGWKILVTSDTGYETERALLESGQNLKSDVWICGRNLQDSMGQDAFVNAIAPKVIITSEQAYPSSEQIPQSWRQWLESKGIAFYSQREHGAVFVVPSKNKLTIKGFLSAQTTTLKP